MTTMTKPSKTETVSTHLLLLNLRYRASARFWQVLLHDVPSLLCLVASTPRLSNQKHAGVNIAIPNANCTQLHKCTNGQMHKCTNAQMHKCTNAQMVSVNHLSKLLYHAHLLFRNSTHHTHSVLCYQFIQRKKTNVLPLFGFLRPGKLWSEPARPRVQSLSLPACARRSNI